MIIGEAPGWREDDLGKPFQGRSGKLLDEMLLAADLVRESIYITNAVHCRPPENRTPTQKEIKACKERLDAEIEMVEPRFILLLGATAYKSVLNKSGVIKHRGDVVEKEGKTYLVTVHPAAVLRQPHLRSVFEADLVRFGRLVRGELEDVQEFNWVLVDTPSKIRQMCLELSKAESISYDLETSGFSPLDGEAKVFCIGLATDTKNYVVPLEYPGSPFLGRSDRVVRMIRMAIMPGTKLIAHNGKFDNKWLKTIYGWDVEQTFDTMLASYLLDENAGHSLKNLAKLHYHAPSYEIMQPVDTENVRLETLAEYCAMDVFYTQKLYHKFKQEILEDPCLVRVFKYLLMPTAKILEDVELRGVYLDPEQYEAAVLRAQETVQDLLAQLNEAAGHELNWNSPVQVALVLYHELELPVLEYTAKGAPSTAETVLLQLRDKHPIVPLLLKYREWVKLSQFLVSWGEHMVGNRIHPNFLIHGTVTGRLSCRNPNLQQVPRDPFLRSIITEEDGWTLVEADYSQVELRVAAMLSGDTTMKTAFQTKQDVHTKTASVVMGVPEDEVEKPDRKKAKAINFGFLYGMGAKKFRIYARDKYDVALSDEEAADFRSRFFDLYSSLPTWHEKQRRIAQKYKFVRTPIGRKRRLPEVDSPDKYLRGEAERQAINSPVQSFASDLTLISMIRLVGRLDPKQFGVVGLVHDALLMRVKDEYLDTALPEIKAVMEDSSFVEERFKATVTVPLEVEIKVGPWGSGTVWEKE